MSRYTDVDALMQNIKHRLGIASLDNLLESEKAIVKEIESAPNIDIVTCYMCKYSHMTYDGQCKYCDNITDDDGNVIEVYFDGSHFCSDGERDSEKPNNCEDAENPSGDVWECGCFLDTYCEHQIYDRNPDGTINIVECGYEPKDEPQTERSE